MQQRRKRVLGLLSAFGVICIWSSFYVISRAGVQTSLTAFDVTALRFMVASLLVLPMAWRWWPRHLPWRATLLMSMCGPGAIYSVLIYLGLSHASAAYGSVFANGSIPLFTMLMAYLATRERPRVQQAVAIAVLVTGAVLVGLPGLRAGGGHVLSGVLLFLSASAILSVYLLGIRQWSLTPRQALALITLPNAALFLPAWYFWLPTGIAEASGSAILLQASFQGLGPGFLAVILFAVATTNLGPTPMAGVAAAVPASASLLALVTLGERPVAIEWVGSGVVTLGLVLLFAWRPEPRAPAVVPARDRG
ncbi:MAG: DMT family transporter [Burkholderiaceae bacterium]